MNSAGITNNLSTEQLPSEVFYHTPNNTMDPDHLGYVGVFPDREICNWRHADIVPAPYGGLNLPPMDSHGGWVVNAPDLARFLVEMESPTGVLDEDYRNLMWSRQEGRSLRVSLLKSLNEITDYTIAARTGSSLTFPAPASTGEWLIIAKGLSQFSSVEIDVATPGNGYELRFLYSAAGITKEFDPKEHNLVDGTDGFQQDGTISFTPPADWQPQTFGGFDGKPRYFIAILTNQNPTTDAELEYAWPSPGEVGYGLGWETTEVQIGLQVAFGLPVYPAGKTVVGSQSKAQARVVATLPSPIPLPNAANIVMDQLVGGPFIPGENLFIDNVYVGKTLARDIARTASTEHSGLLWGTRTWIVHRRDGVNFVLLFNQDNHGAYYLPNEGRILSAIDGVIDNINSTTTWPNIDLFP
jgi:hypothetical protein